MTQPDEPVDRIPLSHSVRYAARGLPELPYQYGRGTLVPTEITLTYRAAPDSQLGRVYAYVVGRIHVDGREIPHGPYGQHYHQGLENWPGWLTEEARLHDPDAALPSTTSLVLTDAERTMLTYALDQAQEHIWSRDGFTDEDQAAVTLLRRLAVEPAAAEPADETLRCVCGDPVQLMDDNDPTSWIHSPGSDTRCLDARPRCPHCQMPHDLTPDSLPVTACQKIRDRIAEAERSHIEGDHSLCCRADCEVLRQS